MNSFRFAYLAVPYSDKNNWKMKERYWKVNSMTAKLMQAGLAVHSPITQGHAIISYLPEELKHSHDFWLQADIEILSRCDCLVVLTLDGWETSRGVQEEIDYAYQKNIPMLFVDEKAEVSDLKAAIKHVKDKLFSMEIVQNASIN